MTSSMANKPDTKKELLQMIAQDMLPSSGMIMLVEARACVCNTAELSKRF